MAKVELQGRRACRQAELGSGGRTMSRELLGVCRAPVGGRPSIGSVTRPIVQIVPELRDGGVAAHALALARELHQAGFVTTFLTCNGLDHSCCPFGAEEVQLL